MADTSNSDVPALVIAEQTGDQRTVTLTGRGLPYRPIAFGTSHRAEFTPYPGNPVRTVQGLGPQEDDSTWNGVWKDRFIGLYPYPVYYSQNGQLTYVQTVVDLIELFNDIVRKGQEVVVQWGPEVRRGLLTNVTRQWMTIHDVMWSFKFEWSSQNDPEVPAVLAKDTDFANAQGSLTTKVQALTDLIDDAISVAPNRLASMTAFVTQVGAFVGEFQATTSNALDTIMPIMDQMRRLAGIMASIGDTCDDAIAFANEFPSVEQVVPTIPASEGPTLAVESFLRQWTTTCRDTKFLAFQTQASILRSVNPNILVAFTARADTDLRDISTQFYQTPDEWKSLMVFNDLPSSKLIVGDTVFVPQLLRPLDGSQ